VLTLQRGRIKIHKPKLRKLDGNTIGKLNEKLRLALLFIFALIFCSGIFMIFVLKMDAWHPSFIL